MRNARRIATALACALLGCAGPSPQPARAPVERGTAEVAAPQRKPAEAPPLLQLPRDVHPLHYALDMRIAPDEEHFAGTARIDVRLDEPRDVIWLHGRGLEVREATVAGIPARYEQVNPEGLARLVTDRPIGPGTVALQLSWEREFDPQIVGLYRTQEAGRRYAYTQFEAVDARRAFPGFDEPDFKTPFDVTLTVPENLVAIANTSPAGEENVGNGLKKIRFATTKPLPTYLLLWAVGPFDVVAPPALEPNDLRSRPLEVRGVAPEGRGGELEFALKTGADLLLLLEQYFG
ncbi:MAG TPA: M1 family peptidase, partial [Myxococcales bacterium]|nr:M1 family peptidase [Myxococcales bacterium]